MIKMAIAVLSPGAHRVVILHAVIGSISTLCLLVLLGHVISVSFVPLCRSAFNLRRTGQISHSSSTGGSNSGEVGSTVLAQDRKSSMAQEFEQSSEGMDIERARALADRRARARAREISRQKSKYNEERLFLRMQLGVFIVCMLLSDLIQTLGVLIQVRWASTGRVEPGMACWVQAAMLTFGDVATAVWNAVIACHTFTTVVLGVRMSTVTVGIIVVLGWTFPIMMNVVGSVIIAGSRGDYYDVAGAWCFISDPYSLERVVLHYVPLLASAFIITIMYSLVSLTMRGNLHIAQSTRGRFPWLSVSFRRTSIHPGTTGNTNQKQVAYLRSLSLKMLWYPCVYIALILPISICRMVELKHKKAPKPLLYFSMTLLFLVGISNVAIYVSTRNMGRPKRHVPTSSVRNTQSGTQVEIFIDRVTQQDVGLVTIGGTKLNRGTSSAVRFEGDPKKYGVKSGEEDASSRASSEHQRDFKSPTSATQFTPRSPIGDRERSHVAPFQSAFEPPITHSNHTRIHTPTRSVGSIVIDKVGGAHLENSPPFDTALTERETVYPPTAHSSAPFQIPVKGADVVWDSRQQRG